MCLISFRCRTRRAHRRGTKFRPENICSKKQCAKSRATRRLSIFAKNCRAFLRNAGVAAADTAALQFAHELALACYRLERKRSRAREPDGRKNLSKRDSRLHRRCA